MNTPGLHIGGWCVSSSAVAVLFSFFFYYKYIKTATGFHSSVYAYVMQALNTPCVHDLLLVSLFGHAPLRGGHLPLQNSLQNRDIVAINQPHAGTFVNQ